MDDSDAMDVLDSSDEFVEHPAGGVLVDPLVFNYVVEELTVLHVLHHQKKLFGGFDYLIELDDVRVPDQLQDVDLSGHPLSVRHFRYFAFFKYFDGHLFVGELVQGRLDLPKSALSDGFP